MPVHSQTTLPLTEDAVRTFTCPACSRPLYNRRRASCEFCGKPVPTSLLLSAAERARIDDLRSNDLQKRRQRYRLNSGAADGGSYFGGWFGGDGGGSSDSGGGG